jgi:hypothetical protein
MVNNIKTQLKLNTQKLGFEETHQKSTKCKSTLGECLAIFTQQILRTHKIKLLYL